MSQAPAMPLFWGDYWSKTRRLSPTQHHAYLFLLGATWMNNCQPFPDDDEVLAGEVGISVAAWKKVRSTLVRFFDLSGGTWRNHKLEEVWEFVAAKMELNASKGRKGAAVRWSPEERERKKTIAAARAGNPHTPEQWQAMLAAFGGACCSCGSTGSIEKDHVLPTSKGGGDQIENLQPLCASCNRKKGASEIDYRDGNALKTLLSKIAGPLPKHMPEHMPEHMPTHSVGNGIQNQIQREEGSLLGSKSEPSKGADAPSLVVVAGTDMPAPSPQSPPADDPKRELYAIGKEVLGPNSGGLVSKLLANCGNDIAQARYNLGLAQKAVNAREYVGAILRGEKQVDTDYDALYRANGMRSDGTSFGDDNWVPLTERAGDDGRGSVAPRTDHWGIDPPRERRR